jgi:hypothetical protein
MSTADFPSTDARLLDLIGGFWTTQALFAAADLGIPDVLAGTACDATTVAAAVHADVDATTRLLLSLESLGVCTADADGKFGLTDMGLLLSDRHPQSLRGWVLMTGRHMWRNWGGLTDAVRTGSAGFRRCGETDRFSPLAERQQEAADFNRAMTELTRYVADEVAALVGGLASDGATVVDVGGGHGELLSVVLAGNPALRGVDFDLPHAEPGAWALLQARGLAGRAGFVAGNFFETVPEGEVLLLKSVLHDWDDPRCTELLLLCAQALPASGFLIVVERLLPEQVQARRNCQAICRSDLNMLVGTGGRERQLGAYERLLGAAHLTLEKVVSAQAGFALMVCRRIQEHALLPGFPDSLQRADA